MPAWALGFTAALLVALISVGQCRRLATDIGFVDIPGDRKSHRTPIPYLGGVGLILGVLTALVFELPVTPKVALVMVAATILGTIGLMDDDRMVSPLARFAAELVAASIATAAGVKIHATGMPTLDAVLTVLWIVGITNALNLLDNMDGLAAGLTTIAATSVFALAVAAGQPLIATLAAGTVGACLGFLFYNRPPARIFMGDTGSLFLGFLLAVMTIDVDSALDAPRGFLVPLLVLGIPIVDTTMVTLARLRRRRSPFMGGRDHLSHRLVARGLSPKRAVIALLSIEALVATLAVLAGRKMIPLGWAVAASVVIVGSLAVRTARVAVYTEPVVGLPRVIRRALLGVAVAVPLVGAPAAIALLRASGPARHGATAAIEALKALETGDGTATQENFRLARASLGEARRRLDGPLVSAGLAIPGLSSNLRAARTLVSVGYELAGQGVVLADTYSADTVRVADGTVPLGEIDKLEPLLTRAETVVAKSRSRLSNLETAFVVPPLARAVEDASFRLQRQHDQAQTVVELARVVPGILGGTEPRHYFLAFQNNAELRGSGGFLGNWGELSAEGGRLQITRFGRLEDLVAAGGPDLKLEGMDDFLRRWRDFGLPATWQNVNVSPDFPTTARVIEQLYPQSGGRQIDGVIAVDPYGLASLMQLTGPVTVPNWPQPISGTNVVDVTLRQAYQQFPQDARVEFLGDVAEAVSAALTRVDIANPSYVGTALSRATAEQHIKLHLTRPEEQHLVAQVGADGALPEVRGDSLAAVTQNVGANKIDYYLTRTVHYDVQLAPRAGGREASLTARVQVDLKNWAPSTGLPPIVIGPSDNRFAAGENRLYLSLYTPFALTSATVGGQTVPAVSERDVGRIAHSVMVSVPPLQATTVQMDIAGKIQLSDDGWYRLDLPHQASVNPDRLQATVNVPTGWRIVEARNATLRGDRAVVADRQLTAPETIWVRVERTGVGRITDRLLHSR